MKNHASFNRMRMPWIGETYANHKRELVRPYFILAMFTIGVCQMLHLDPSLLDIDISRGGLGATDSWLTQQCLHRLCSG